MSESPWFIRPLARRAVRLFCFPYAGGSAAIFHRWAHTLTDVDVCAIQLPGRANRLTEPAFTDFDSLVDVLLSEILPHADQPFALFGHSMGALIAFRLAQRLQELQGAQPLAVFASACAAPQLAGARHWELADDAALLQTLRAYGGTPAEVLNNPELMELLLPMLRADFQLLASYRHEGPVTPLSCPIHVLSGADDPCIPAEQYAKWQDESRQTGTFTVFPGGHLFLHDQIDQVGRHVHHLLLDTPSASVTRSNNPPRPDRHV